MHLALRLALVLAALTLLPAAGCGDGGGAVDAFGGDLVVVRPDVPDAGAPDVLPTSDTPPETSSPDAQPPEDVPGDAAPDGPPPIADLDEDGVADGEDNCPAVRNTDQKNFDGDEFGDLCDLDDGDDDGVLDYEDEAPTDPDWPGRVTQFGVIYAHTSDTLFTWRPGDAVEPEKVGTFEWPAGLKDQQMTDLAIDGDGLMYGVSFDHLYRVSAASGKTRSIGTFDKNIRYNGLTLVPRGTVNVGAETLIAISTVGGWYNVKLPGGTGPFTLLGSYGNGYGSAGDAFSIEDKGTWAAVTDEDPGTLIVGVNAKTGAAINPPLARLDATAIYGLAGVGSRIYAFDESGQVLAWDMSSNEVTVVLPANDKRPWWGAAVSTRGK